MLEIKDLSVEVEGKSILSGFNMSVKAGEVHAIMGPNGSGKSTLAKVLAGDPLYAVTQGDILLEGKSILAMAPEERALEGIFMAYQYPVEIPGVNSAAFLRMAYNARLKKQGKDELDPMEFNAILKEKIKVVKMPEEYLHRAVNHGFSGGEKKRNEILQMAVFEPKLAILDETDSGLDIDALKVVSQGIEHLRSPKRAIILITHYQRILNHVVPDKVHILADGRIIKTGDKDLAHEMEKKGYDWLRDQDVATESLTLPEEVS